MARHFRGKELVFNVVLGGVLVPATALALPLYLMLSKASFDNTLGGTLVAVIPLMIAIGALRRFWRTGLTQGRVKG